MRTTSFAFLSVLLSLLAVTFLSCASGPYAQKEPGVLKLVSLINEGKVSEVKGLSPAPFVLDTETLYLESDVATLWKNLKGASFAMDESRFVSSKPVDGDSYRAFADTYDMKNFFASYTGKDTSLVTVDTADGRYLLLLERPIQGYPRIRGMRGPIQ